MKKILLSIVVLGGFLFVQSCSNQASAEKVIKSGTNGIPVKVITLQPRPFSQYIRLTGTVRARNQIKIIAEEAGTLSKIEKAKGTFVRRGEVLAQLKNEILQAAFHDAQAAYDQALLTFNSNKALFAKKAIAENQFKASKLGLKRAQAALEMARVRVGKLTITAPVKGYVNDRYPDLGAYITPGTPLFELVDNSSFTVRAQVAERYIAYIKEGAAVQVGFDALPGLTLQGRVRFVSKSIDAGNRTFTIEAALSGDISRLAPYMIANLRVLKNKQNDAVVVPLDAIIESEKGRYVFLNDSGKARKQFIHIREISAANVLVDSLQNGEQLIVLGQRQVSDGDQLRVIK